MIRLVEYVEETDLVGNGLQQGQVYAVVSISRDGYESDDSYLDFQWIVADLKDPTEKFAALPSWFEELNVSDLEFEDLHNILEENEEYDEEE